MTAFRDVHPYFLTDGLFVCTRQLGRESSGRRCIFAVRDAADERHAVLRPNRLVARKCGAFDVVVPPVRVSTRPGRPARPTVCLPSTSSHPKRRVSGSGRADGRRGAILVFQGRRRPIRDAETVDEFVPALRVHRRRPRAREGREQAPLVPGTTVLAEVRRSSTARGRRTRPAAGARPTTDDLRTCAAGGRPGFPGKATKSEKIGLSRESAAP